MTKSVRYLTPIFAKMAYEQIEAWYTEESQNKKQPLPALSYIVDTNNIPGANIIRLKSALEAINVDMQVLIDNGIAEKQAKTAYNCGSTGYERDNSSYRICMDKLFDIAVPR